MAISSHFQDEIDAVDNTKTLSFVVDTTNYTEWQWSYNGLEITGGSDLACEYGASALLEAMGFRWYSPNPNWGYVRPPSIPTNLTAAKQENYIPNPSVFLVYGHSWGGSLSASRTTLEDRWEKFQTLNGVKTNPWPAGHRWNNVITSNQAYFDSNPQLLLDSSKFDLTVTGTDYDNLTEICAAHILNEGLNEWNRSNFDPTDGDTQSSDLVFSFSKDVVDKVRAGTDAIGTIGAQVGVADAQLGVYAYGGHDAAPTNSVSPGIYTQVALGFNNTELTFLELVQAHAAKADSVSLRDYWDTQVWSAGRPFFGRTKTDSFDEYTSYVTNGVAAFLAEFTANWLVQMVGFRYGVLLSRDGTSTYTDALDDVMADIFGDDAKVRELYELWSAPSQQYHKWNLRKSFDIVNDMQAATWYKPYFQHLCVILYEQLYLPSQLDPADPDFDTASDPFRAAAENYFSHITAIRELDIAHSYAFLRQEANARVSNYDGLGIFSSPEPDWFSSPTLPTEAEFNSYRTSIQNDTVRDADLDSTDLVIYRNITPQVSGADVPEFHTQSIANYVFVGPGDVTYTEVGSSDVLDGASELTNISGGSGTVTYGAGIHYATVQGDYRVSNSGGDLFLDMFPRCRLEPTLTTGNSKWLYIPKRLDGSVDIESESRMTVWDANGRLDITPSVDTNLVSNLGPGQIRIDDVNTRGFHNVINANRYASLNSDVVLVPRVIGSEDFFALGDGQTEANLVQSLKYKGAVQPSETSPTGNEIRLWKGAVEPAEPAAASSAADALIGGVTRSVTRTLTRGVTEGWDWGA